MEKEQPDILCLQETRCSKDKLKQFQDHFQDYSLVHLNETKGKKGHSGVLIASKFKPIALWDDFPFLDEKENIHEGRIITVEFDDFYMINVYVPNSGSRFKFRVEEWDFKFRKHILHLQNKESSRDDGTCPKAIVITGDLNCIVDPGKREGLPGGSSEEIGNFSTLLKECSLIDSYRTKYPNVHGYTWFAPWQKSLALRLDYFLLSSDLLDEIESLDVLDQYRGSDHVPLRIVMKSE